jgi:DNA-binding FadR family transcriptional regulator
MRNASAVHTERSRGHGGVAVRLLSGDARRAVFAPLDDGALRSEAVARRVGSAIALGLLAPGEQLPAEAELATQLNVSTVTLRDALAELRRLGLVETRRGRGGGSFVRSRDEALTELADARLAELATTDLRELGDAHGAVASAAARLAAARASTAEVARLRDVVDRLAAADSEPARRRADGRFYVELAACAQSVRLTMQQMDLLLEFGQLPWAPGRSAELLDAVVAGHRAVLDAVEARDPASARDLTQQHVDARTRWLVELRLRPVAGRATAAAGVREEIGA